MSGCRIGRVRMKAGGADVRVLRGGKSEGDFRGKIVEHARRIAGYSAPGSELVSFAIVGVYSDGTYSIGTRRDIGRCRVPMMLWPSFVAECIRRDTITEVAAEKIACDVFNRAHGYDPEP